MMDPVTNYLNIWNMLAKQIGLVNAEDKHKGVEENESESN